MHLNSHPVAPEVDSRSNRVKGESIFVVEKNIRNLNSVRSDLCIQCNLSGKVGCDLDHCRLTYPVQWLTRSPAVD